ncbi:MAG: DHA2 family efflux MFS transporter permease subunit [Solirubrobacterales bacterium]
MRQNPADRLDWSIVIVIIIGTFMAILDGSIMNVALPQLMAIFGVSTDKIQWVLTGYMLTMGVIMPASGYLGDTFGYKRTYILALAVFVLGSALCGLSWNVESMMAFRIVQAIGGGVLQPLGMAIIYQSYPRAKIGMVLGVWGIAAMAAPAIGPTLGGWLVDAVSWRFIFYLNVPIGLLNLFLAGLILKETPRIKGHHFDGYGLITSAIGLFCLLLAFSDGTKYGWGSPFIVSLFGIAAVSLTLFVINEWNHPEPLLNLRLMQNFVFSVSLVIGSVLAIGMFGAIFLIPIFLQNVVGLSAMKTGIIMFPAALASGLMMPISGRLFDKYGAKGIVAIGIFLVAGPTFIMSGFTEMTPFSDWTFWMVIRGLGMGFAMMPVTTAGMNTVAPNQIGHASALSTVIRQIASSFGVAMFTTVLQTRQVYHFQTISASANLNSNEYINAAAAISNLAANLGLGPSMSQILGLSLITRRAVSLSMTLSIQDCFMIAAVICAAVIPLAWFLKRSKEHTHVPHEIVEEPLVIMD